MRRVVLAAVLLVLLLLPAGVVAAVNGSAVNGGQAVGLGLGGFVAGLVLVLGMYAALRARRRP